MHIKVSRNGADRIGRARQFRDGVFGADAKAPPVSKVEAAFGNVSLERRAFWFGNGSASVGKPTNHNKGAMPVI